MKRKLWNTEEIEKAIALYITLPFGRIDRNNIQIINLANSIGRTPSSVALKLANLASLDETLDRKGMNNASKLDQKAWSLFFDKMISVGKNLPDIIEPKKSYSFQDNDQDIYINEQQEGLDIFRITTARQGQSKFREMILANYENKCAISHIQQPELLIAGHISPWSEDPENRLNPRNGILLNRLHDKAYENGLIAVDDNGKILYADKLEKHTFEKLISMNTDGYLSMPTKFKPDPFLLMKHKKFHESKGINFNP
jgi:putative restriction endonuclease